MKVVVNENDGHKKHKVEDLDDDVVVVKYQNYIYRIVRLTGVGLNISRSEVVLYNINSNSLRLISKDTEVEAMVIDNIEYDISTPSSADCIWRNIT